MDFGKFLEQKAKENERQRYLHYCDNNTTLDDFINYCQSSKKLAFYCDIETLQVNTKAYKSAKKSEVKSYMYSHCLSFPWKNDVKTICFANAYDFLKAYSDYAQPKSSVVTRENGKRERRNIYEIELHYFNGRKYDNHFVIQDSLKKDWGCTEANFVRAKTKDTPDEYKSIAYAEENEVLTSRVRTSTSVDAQAYLNDAGNRFYIKFVDDYPKFDMSLRKVGKMLKEIGIITDNDLKTDFNYSEFDIKDDMDYLTARSYCYEVFKKLNNQQKRYIFNDTRLLCYAMINFEKVMYGFDPKKATLTMNVMDAYINPNGKYNPLVDIQLKRNVQAKSKNQRGFHQQLSQYTMDSGKNLMDWLYKFYFGGACHYNDIYVGEKLSDSWGSADSNSHYPSSYCRHPLPLGQFIKWESYETPTSIPINFNTDEVTAFYEVPIAYFNFILEHTPSHYMRTGIYHYLNRPNERDSRYLTNIHLKAIRENCGVDLTDVLVYDMIEVENVPFKGNETVYHFYKIKTEAGTKTEVVFKDGTPFNIEVTDKPIPSHMIGSAKKQNAKHCVNNLYGLPAIRQAYAKYITDETGELYRIPNGHKNQERNVLFSIATTAWAWFHLWEPLQGYEASEIDRCMYYQDTDSLYMKADLLDRIIKDKSYLFDSNNLGCWDIEHRGKYFYIQTHKKYCFMDNTTGLDFRFGGVPKEAFDTSLSFDEFIEKYMAIGCKIPNTRSIMTTEGKPAIYETVTEVKQAYKYRTRVQTGDYALYDYLVHTKEFKEEYLYESSYNDFLYIMSELGGITRQMIEPIQYEPTEKTLFDAMDDYNRLLKLANEYYYKTF